MIKNIRQTLNHEEGQALVIGGLMLLLLAFGILVTLNIGRAVEEKVRVQNAADAAAYSMAVLEAQSFNYVAFMNRTQLSHYNSMMTLQTMANYLVFIEGALGTILDFLWTLTTILDAIATLLYIIGIGAAMDGFIEGLNAACWGLYNVILGIRQGLYGTKENDQARGGVISVIGLAIKGMWYFNYVQYMTENLFTGLIGVKLLGGGATISDKNLDQNNSGGNGGGGVQDFLLNAANAGLNAYSYIQVFDKTAGGMPFIPVTPGTTKGLRALKPKAQQQAYDKFNERDATLKANQRIMAEIANATRNESGFLSNSCRGFATNSSSGCSSTSSGGFGEFIGDVLSPFIQVSALGKTKLTTYVPEPQGIESALISGYKDYTGLSVVTLLEERNKGGKNGVSTNSIEKNRLKDPDDEDDGRFFWVARRFDMNYDDRDYYKAQNYLSGGRSYYRVDNYRPTGDYLASYHRFNFWLGIDFGEIPGVNKLIDYKATLLEIDIYPALVSNRHGGKIYRWKRPEEWMVNTMKTSNTKAYFRTPVSAWDMLGPFKGIINTCVTGNIGPIPIPVPPIGCGDSLTKCEDRNLIKFCKAYSKKCCEFRKKMAAKKGETFEKVKHKANDSNHNVGMFWMGMGPYMKFKPNRERKEDFNQPSTWSLQNQPFEAFADGNVWNLDKSDKKISLDYGVGMKTLSVAYKDTSEDSNSGASDLFGDNPLLILKPGLNAIARARVYYHRPGNWEEPPNFFNPYWRAQLAPIAERMIPLLKDMQEKVDAILKPLIDAIPSGGTGISSFDNLLNNVKSVLTEFTGEGGGIARIIIGMIAH